MKKILLIVAFLFATFSFLSGQTYNIADHDGETISACSGAFGVGSYTPGTTYTMTICSDDALNRHIVMAIAGYSFPDGTELCVYDGPDATAPQLVCWNSSTTSSSVAAFAQNTNESGCLTFVFTSTVAGASWNGTISCQFVCPAPIEVNIVSAIPDFVNESGVEYINVCWDEDAELSEDVTFIAQGTFPSGAGYALDDANVTYTWNFNDGSAPETGMGLTTVTHNFPNRQGYTIIVSIEDSQGCVNTNSETQRVRVSRAPLWSESGTVDPLEICMGEQVEMCAAYATAEWNSSVVPEISGQTELPDGSGVCYETELMQNQFLPDQVLEDINDLNGIHMNLEHSFLGDLTFAIQCPNGQSVMMEEQAGGGTFLGEPIDDTSGDPGVPYWYIISPNGTETMADAASSVSTLPAGEYASFESLNGLIGCPLNGLWTITICDNWAADDGNIFGWFLDFDESLFPEMWSYIPDYSPTNWYGLFGSQLNNPLNEDCATGTYMTTDNPSVDTQQPFIFTLTDDFGCEHDTAMYVTVYNEDNPSCCQEPTPDAGTSTTACGLSYNLDASAPLPDNNGFWQLVSGPGTATFANETAHNSLVSVSVFGTYEFSWTEQYFGNPACATVDNVTIQFEDLFNPTITPISDMCRTDLPVELEMINMGNLSSNPAIPNLTTGIINPADLEPGTTYTITNAAPGSCYTSPSDQISFEIFDELDITNFNDQECLPGPNFVVEFDVVDSDGSPVNLYNINGLPVYTSHYEQTISSPNSYNYTVTDNNGCSLIPLDGYRDCGCPTVGTMGSLDLVDLCGNACTGGQVLHSGYVPQLNSVLGYIIHDGDPYTPLAYNSTEPDFCRAAFGGEYGHVYYVTAVTAYDDNSNGQAETGEGCYSFAQPTPVRWMQIPIPDAGLPQDTCGLILTLDGSAVPDGMLGYWTAGCDFAPVGGTDTHNPNMQALVSEYAECTFTWHIVNGQCVGDDDVVLSFNSDPSPFAGNDTIVCGKEIELSVDNSIPGTTFQWSGDASFNPSTGATTTVTVNTPGTYEFTLTEFNGSCFDSDEIIVSFIEGPQPTVVNNVDTACGTYYCLEVNNVQGEGVWTAYDEGTQIYPIFDDENSPQTCVSIPNYTGNYRTVEFVWTESNTFQNVVCESSVSIDVTFARIPNAFGGATPDDVCGNVYQMNADTTGTGWANMYWLVKDGIIAEFDDASLPDAVITIDPLSSFGDSAQVTVPIQWITSSGAGCADIDTVYITFYEAPNANAGLDAATCGLQYNLEAFYSILPSMHYTPEGYWENVDGNPGSVNIDNIDSNNTIVNVGTEGEYTFVWREINEHYPSCESTDTVVITFKEIPEIFAGEDFDVCGQDACLSAVSAGYTFTWQQTPGASFDDQTLPGACVHYGGYGPVDFYILESNDECVSADTVTVTFWRTPTAVEAVAAHDTLACGLEFTRLRANNPGEGVTGYWISVPSNGVTFYNQSYDDTVSVLNFGDYDFYWVESTGPDNAEPDFCTDTSEVVPVVFVEVPVANAGLDTIFCGLEGQMNAEFSVAGSTGSWIDLTSNVDFEDYTNPETPVSSNIYTSDDNSYFDLVWTENNMTCTDADTVRVEFARIPIATVTVIPPRCEGEAASILANDDDLVGYSWNWNGGIVDSTWEANAHGGFYRHLVRWNNDDTVHSFELTTENEWGCISLGTIGNVYEPYRPEYIVASYPDTCALGLGGFRLDPDTTTVTDAPGFSWINLDGETEALVIGDTTFNVPAGTYTAYHSYNTFNNSYTAQYIDLFGTQQCRDTFDLLVDTAGLVYAEIAISSATDMNALVAPNAEVWFDNLSDGDNVRTSCTWYFGDGESTNSCDDQISHVYTEPNECYEPYFVIRVKNLPECRDTAFLECIEIDDMSLLEIPNVFTPNGDGMNDFFQVKAQTLQSFQGIIVNRWGVTIYEWTDYETKEAGWDGRTSGGSEAAPGVYYFIVKAVGMDGIEYEETGPFHLVRGKE